GDETEVLRIATQPTFGARWLVPRLKGFGDRYPRIHLDVRNELEPFDLVQAKADVAFFFGQGTWPGATCIELFSEEVVPVCSPQLLASHRFDSAQALTEHRLLQCVSRPEAWHEWFLGLGLHSQNSYHGPRFDTFYLCIRAAISGCGIALIPRYLVAEELSEGKLVVAWDHPVASNGRHFIAHAEHAAEVPKIRAFVQWIRERVAEGD
ncbi:MAG: LysR substrate-binding domain-containing protein, partial [Pseudomonas alloputida]